MTGRPDLRLGITDVAPVVSCGSFSARAVVGELLPITATVFREGHDAVAANVVWTPPDGADPDDGAAAGPLIRMERYGQEPDRWLALVSPDREGRWSFRVEAWSDPLATWRHAVEVKIAAGQGPEDLANDLEEGARLLDRVAADGPEEHRDAVAAAAGALRDGSLDLTARVAPALTPALQRVLHDHPVRELVTRGPRYEVWVDRRRALYGSWYEFFPRSEGAVVGGKPTHGTFATAADRLPAVADMGFDVVYLPPIHPIGEVNRKGRNNTLTPAQDDVGSPWAIGSAQGGHDAVHPQLGSYEDFRNFVRRAGELGLEVALDLALQAAPDHPWVKEHPEWFTTKPDGSIAYAENPPKKYQDIYPINFDNDPEGLYAEVLRVVRHWMAAGVRIFRVDNPHTKPLNFWHWLIWEVKKTDPDVLFLAEAFTRPAMMHQLARIGFTQSYTYFTWRTGRGELEDYGRELARCSHYMRPNFFVNTPDILHESLQFGGPPMFKIRAVLASMMSPTWGVYSGFELFEHVAVRPGSEEYLDSEKYQLRPRDWAAAEASGRSLAPYLRRLNEIRRAHPALQQLRSLRFHPVDNPNLICFSKTDPGSGDAVLVVVNLASHHTQIGTTALDLPVLGLDWHERFSVTDEITGATYDWGQFNYVELDPYREPAHVFSVSFGRPVQLPPPVD
jgi:starch synthase (maltosyl-transferring)